MTMDHARRIVRDAIAKGLTLHGISENGKPAIGFDSSHPQSAQARRSLQQSDGVYRELIRAAMVEECLKRGLPQGLPVPFANHMLALNDAESNPVLH